MNYLLLPDFFAMALLLGVLVLVRRRYPQHDIRLWMGGLLLILLECGARILYELHLPTAWHRVSHAVALDAYLSAGVVFLRSSLEALRRMPRSTLYTWINTLPAAALLTVYGLGLRNDMLNVAICAAGIVTAVVSSLALRRPRTRLISLLAIWIPTTVAAAAHAPRVAVYLVLALVYLVTAIVFDVSLPPRSSGKIAVVIGFVLWSACFLTHPWIATSHPSMVALASQVWNLQKFLITVGFLVVLFEKQVDTNEWLALHDQLTDLPNRRLFEDRIANAIARAERDRTALILFALDLNHFKEVNDTMGHEAGDALLRSVASRLRDVVRRTDTLARLGGDEFVLLATDVKAARAPKKERRWLRADPLKEEEVDLPLLAEAEHTLHTTEHPVLRHAYRIEQDIRSAIDRPVQLETSKGEATVEISISIGVAVYPTDSTELAELTRIADSRMYEDKRRQNAERGSLKRVLSMLSA